MIAELSFSIPHYQSLEWRLDIQVNIIIVVVVFFFDLFTLLWVGLDFSPLTIITLQVGSRTEHRQMKSVYTLQLETMSAGTTRARVNALACRC